MTDPTCGQSTGRGGLAELSGLALVAVGVPVTVQGSSLLLSGNAFTVVPNCDGVILVCCFFAVATAAAAGHPGPQRRRLLGHVAAVTASLILLNWDRLLMLTATAFFAPTIYEFVHTDLLNSGIVLATVMISVLWVRRTLRSPPFGSAGPARPGALAWIRAMASALFVGLVMTLAARPLCSAIAAFTSALASSLSDPYLSSLVSTEAGFFQAHSETLGATLTVRLNNFLYVFCLPLAFAIGFRHLGSYRCALRASTVLILSFVLTCLFLAIYPDLRLPRVADGLRIPSMPDWRAFVCETLTDMWGIAYAIASAVWLSWWSGAGDVRGDCPGPSRP